MRLALLLYLSYTAFQLGECRTWHAIRDPGKLIRVQDAIDRLKKNESGFVGYINSLPGMGMPHEYDALLKGAKWELRKGQKASKTFGVAQADFPDGAGLELKTDPGAKFATARVALPLRREVDYCGLIIGSCLALPPGRISKINRSSFKDKGPLVSKMVIEWNHSNEGTGKWRPLTQPWTGATHFHTHFEYKDQIAAIMFDPVPAKSFRLKLYPKTGNVMCSRIVFLHSCNYNGTVHFLTCSETLMSQRIWPLPDSRPISIQCPNDCRAKRKCWGHRVYTADSPICLMARQANGKLGDGFQFLYKIPKAINFYNEKQADLNHGIECEEYDGAYPAYAFSRLDHDTAKMAYENSKVKK